MEHLSICLVQSNGNRHSFDLNNEKIENGSLACLAVNYLSKHESYEQTLSEIEVLPTVSSILDCKNSSQPLIHITESL